MEAKGARQTVRAQTRRERGARSLFRGVCGYWLGGDTGAPVWKRRGSLVSAGERLRPRGLLRSLRLLPISS